MVGGFGICQSRHGKQVILTKFHFIYRVITKQCTVYLQRESCIYGEKSYGMSLGSCYKILMIFRQPELEFSKLNVIGAFQDPVTFGGFVLYFASLLNKIQHIGIYFLLMENAEVLMLKSSYILRKYNLFSALEPLRFPRNGNISQYVAFYLVNLQNTRQNHQK